MPRPYVLSPKFRAPHHPQPEEQLARLVERRLRQDPHAALSSIACDVQDGTVTLRGVVPDCRLKQWAQELAFQTQGVVQLVNCIEVAPWEAGDEEHRFHGALPTDVTPGSAQRPDKLAFDLRQLARP